MSHEHININMHILNNYSSRNHSYCKSVMQVAVVACLGMKDTPGRNAESPRRRLPETVLPRKAVYGQGHNGHFYSVKTGWRWCQHDGLDDTKKWALESPRSELRLKRCGGLTARDLSAKILFTYGSLSENPLGKGALQLWAGLGWNSGCRYCAYGPSPTAQRGVTQ